MSRTGDPFLNYLELPSRVPLGVWRTARVLTVGGALGLCAVLIAAPRTGLTVWWGVLVPLLPLVWLIAPGLWRNVCPLAATNQAPRVLEIGRRAAAPRWWRVYAPAVGMLLFAGAVAFRPVVFDESGVASAALIATALAGAFIGGLLLKGKSGWCSSICPLLPVQRLYGQTPFVTVPNAHCRPCVGCTKNCYDFNPRVAYLADLHDDDRQWTSLRKLFAGAFPALVLAFFTAPDPATGDLAGHYAGMALAAAAGAGSLLAAEALLPVSAPKIAAVYGAVAINLFYWFASPILAEAIVGSERPELVWPLRAAVLVASLEWLRRSFFKERTFHERAGSRETPSAARLGAGAAAAAARLPAGDPEVAFEDGARVVVRRGAPLLDVAENAEQRIEAGCRMGVCGADPVCIVAGAENLSPMSDEERDTLERLGLDLEANRMACCARVHGPVTVSLRPRRGEGPVTVPFRFDPAVRRVVVIGNGIAGVTAADHVRRRHPECALDVVAAEPHPLYNRMGVSRLIHGRSAMVGLHLLPDAWYDDNRITCWLNTRAAAIDTAAHEVRLATGETLAYDKLILSMGSQAAAPPIGGFGAPGTFVLRTASDAMEIRRYAQEHGGRRAVVAGGGLLGLEAAYALHKLGLRTVVLERSAWLLPRQLDATAGGLLRTYLHNLGIEVLLERVAREVRDADRLREVVLGDGETLPADVLLAAMGISPSTELARAAGLAVDRGVIVDEGMRTSDGDVFAVGDVAEWRGQLLGLWPVAVEQAEVAAENAVGGQRTYHGSLPVTILKVVGVDLLSLGRIQPEGGGTAVVLEEPETLRYGKLVADAEGRLDGAILFGHPQWAAVVTDGVKQRAELSELLAELGDDRWSASAGVSAAA